MLLLRLFIPFLVRPLRREPLRVVLTVFAVALGVGVVLAMEMAGSAAAGSFRSSLETLAGKADFEVTAVGGVPEEVFARLVAVPYPIRVSPRIEDFAAVQPAGEVVPVVGLDLVAEAFSHANTTSTPWTQGEKVEDAVWVGSALGKRPGETIRLALNDSAANYKVAGILPDVPGSPQARNAVIMDIALAQKALGRQGRLDRVLIEVPQTPALQEWEQILRQDLPAGVRLERYGSRSNENRRMLEAFRWNLRINSYVGLVVGAFLIYNTISVSVVRRRGEIGILRALGATRGAVLALFLAEAGVFGLAGALLGLPLGRVMATGAVRLVGATVESLYVSSQPAPLSLSADAVALALCLGLAAALFSAFAPAREAAGVPPVEAMAPGRREYEARVHKTRDLVLGIVVALAAAAASRLPPVGGKPLFGYLAALLLVVASALATPAVVSTVMAASAGTLRRLLGVEALLASRSLGASLRRTSVLVGALSTAAAMMVSVGIMVGSFRQTMMVWMDHQLQADLYVSPALPPAGDRHPTLSSDVPDRVAAVPGVAEVDRFRAYSISYQGLPATLAGGESRMIARAGRLRFLSGDAAEIVTRLPSGDFAVISEPFANKHQVGTGDTLRLPLGREVHAFRILGVFYDYGNERGMIVMDRATLLKYLPDPAASSLAVFLAPGADAAAVRSAVVRAVTGRQVTVFLNRELRAEAVRIFDRTFAITYALEAVAILVAVMGIAGALLALVIDRRREFGLLRFLGASSGQIRRLILFEAGLLGLLANFAGLALGAVLSLILVFVINKQSFGWTIQFHWPVAVLLGALSAVYLATLLAGLYPAEMAVRLVPIEVIHEE
jgi:putative ABC transport system permease protein